MFMNLNKSGRILGVAFALAVIIPMGVAEAARGGKGGGGGGRSGGGDGNGDGGGAGPGDTPIAFIINDNDDKAPPCTANGCYKPPQITYIVKKNACEIRTCEIEDGVRQCSTRMDDIKVCATKRS